MVSQVRVKMSMMVATLFAAVVLCVCSASQAWANDVAYVANSREVPGSGVFIERIDSSNAVATLLKPNDFTWSWGSPNLPDWYPDCMMLKINNGYDKTYSGDCLRIKATNCGYTWKGERVDVEVTFSNIWVKRRYAAYNDTVLLWFSNGNNYQGKWFTMGTAGVNDRGSYGTSMDVRYKITYTGTDRIVDAPYAFYIDDLDTPQEGVMLHGNLYNTMYLQNDTVCKVDGPNGIVSGRDNADPYGDDDHTFRSGVVTLSNSGDVRFTLYGRAAVMDLGPAYTAYPRRYVSTSKAGDGQLHFEGDTATYKVTATFPYCPTNLHPNSISITDTLDASLDAAHATVTVKKGSSNVTSQFNVSRSGSTFTITHKNPASCEGTYVVEIKAPIKTGLPFTGYARETVKGEAAYAIPNKAVVNVAGSWADALRLETNTAKTHVTWGYLDVTVGSANDSVSQLGQNDCYTLAGTVSGVYKDVGCTNKQTQVTADAQGHAVTGRVPVGTYYVKEITPGPGFALNTEVSSVIKVPGLGTGYTDRDDVPQSEALDGSIMSKRDKELESIGERLNAFFEMVKDLPSFDGVDDGEDTDYDE